MEKPRCEKDCYFCSNEFTGFNKNKIVYVAIASVRAPIPVEPKKCVDDPMGDTVSRDSKKMEIDEQFAEKSESDDDDYNDSDVDYAQCTKKMW